jgi:class 3 adenylate cyclase/CheY-like chemotaxis protein
MTRRVLLLQSDKNAAQALVAFFHRRGDQVWLAANVEQARALLEREEPDLLLIDLHLPGTDWLNFITQVRKDLPRAGVIITNRHPDLRRELFAKERGVQVFLRQPFTPAWIEKALKRLERKELPPLPPAEAQSNLPPVRVPMRAKITLPYALLALLFALASAFLVSRYVLDTLQDRFTAQLIDVGKLTSDWMVQEESRLLESLRLAANTQGVSEAVKARDTSRLRALLIPLAVNARLEALEVLDLQGVSLLSLRHVADGAAADYDASQGDATLAGYDFVQKVLHGAVDSQGDKYAGMARAPWGNYFYISGPVLDENGSLAGVVLVGKSLETLVDQIRQDTLAQVTIYGLDGAPLASTHLVLGEVQPVSAAMLQEVLQRQDVESPIRRQKIASADYSEILGPWEVRSGQDVSVVGAALAENYLNRPTLITNLQALLFVLAAFIGVIALGLFLANQITRPLSQVVRASVEVAKGNLEVKVPTQGNDEVMVLATAFNHMVSGLQEGFIYRDLLGRTVSPEVREAMRRSFASGNLRLEGQSAVATVLVSDIRGFTTISEREEPTTILNWLNEYFGELVPVVAANGGVVDKFEGDSMLSFFGLLPTPLPEGESAYQACKAALEMVRITERINARRAGRGEPPLITGIGVNTGQLTAGGLGTADRLNFTIIGDTVNTAQRMQSITRDFGESGVVISETTLAALGNRRGEFRFEPLGEQALKGKRELLWIYRLLPLPEKKGVGQP